MISDILFTEARRFCQTTSVRGIPRIINSKSIVHFVIWLLGVLTCTSVLVWQVVIVFKRYQSYPVNTVFKQSPQWDSPTFPDITICNLSPLVYEDEMPIGYTDYWDGVFAAARNRSFFLPFMDANARLNSIRVVASIYEYIWSPKCYFLNSPPIEKNETKVIAQSPIFDCTYYNWNVDQTNVMNDWLDCMNSMEEILDPNYYKCYTLKRNNTLRKNTRGFSGVIYVKNMLDNVWNNYIIDIANTRAKGMTVLIHEPGTKPDMSRGIGIEVGKSTTITLQQTKITRLPSPYSNCTTQQTLEPVKGSPSYTQATCIDICQQDIILKQCGCVFNVYQYTDSQLQRANNSMCGNTNITSLDSSFDWKSIEQLVCVFSNAATANNKDACNRKCPLPCTEYRYSPTIYANYWPHVTYLLSVFISYGMKLSKRMNWFSQYMDNFSDYFQFNLTTSFRNIEKFDKDGLIQGYLLQLNIQFDTNDYQEQADVVAFSLDAFGAQIGGVLSLWLGVTILLIVEVCEFIINLLSAIWSGKRSQQGAVAATDEIKL